MSLLYECINGIIQGGILGGGEDSAGDEEIAKLCVSKLRGMIMVEGDANCEFPILCVANVLLICNSKICCAPGFQQDCCDSFTSRCRAGRRYHGMY